MNEQAGDDNQEQRKPTQEEMIQIITQRVYEVMDPITVQSALFYGMYNSDDKIVRGVTNNVTRETITSITIMIERDEKGGEEAVQLPENVIEVRIDAREHEKLVNMALVYGLPLLREIIELNKEKNTVTIRSYVINPMGAGIVYWDEITGELPKPKS